MLFFLRVLRFLPLLLFLLMAFKVLYGILGQERRQRQYQRDGSQRSRNDSYHDYKESADPYEVLGCKRSDSDEVIRKRYRELVAKYHPDKFIGQNLDKEFIEFASKKFQRIQSAYERIRRERGMR
ncbi:MAG: DnaJ like chaperone protein [Synergistales bacterium]|nr:DnaJ like chaperone protein [Synergistales bacterium]